MSGAPALDRTDQLAAVGQIDPELPFQERMDSLRATAQWVRRLSLRRAHATGHGHLGSELSVTDILVALYCSVMTLPTMDGTSGADADRLILSKGHAAVALYASMVAGGVLAASRLRADGRDGLPAHPVRGSLPGIDVTTGALGHGLPLAVGAALAARMDDSRSRTFVVLGDGELQEGSNWEAFMLAAHLQLGSLVAVIDANGLQQGSRVSATNGLEPLPAKLEAFGWRCDTVDGHDFGALLGALAVEEGPAPQPPRAIIARTIKGQGVSFMMNESSWHHRTPDDHELAVALTELDG